MANRLRMDLTGKRVVMRGDGPEPDRIVTCKTGFGCFPYNLGEAIFGEDATGQPVTVSGRDVQKLAPEEEHEPLD